MAAAPEPGSRRDSRRRCRVTPGRGRGKAPQRTDCPACGVRVKRWGKSPPRDGQPDRHGKPHREQCRIGTSRGARPRAASAQRSGLAARSRRQRRGQRNGHRSPDLGPGGTESGLQALRAPPWPAPFFSRKTARIPRGIRPRPGRSVIPVDMGRPAGKRRASRIFTGGPPPARRRASWRSRPPSRSA
jgi:hypothetical protein